MERSNEAIYWRQCAEGARATAKAMRSPEGKREMLQMAEAYDRMAEHTERTAGRKASGSRG